MPLGPLDGAASIGPRGIRVQRDATTANGDGRADETVLQELMLDLYAHESVWQVERVDQSEYVAQEGSR